MKILAIITVFVVGIVSGMFIIALLYNEQYFEKMLSVNKKEMDLERKIRQYQHAVELVEKSKEM